jgi:hypothetical protein
VDIAEQIYVASLEEQMETSPAEQRCMRGVVHAVIKQMAQQLR